MILRSVKWLLITLAIIVVLLVVSVATITVMAVQKTPLVASTAPTQLDGADSVNELLGQLQQAFSRLFWQQGEWDAVYIPAQFERLPFYVGTEAQSADSSNRVLCIDMDNASVSEEKGTPLFDNTGEPSNYLLEKQQILAQLLDGETQNQRFIAALQQHNLITPFTLDITFENESKTSITGLYTIDEDKLAALSADAIADLHAQHMLQSIYTLIASNAQIYALIDKKNKANKNADAWFQTTN